MKLAAHELNLLSELSMSCVNTITNMAYMLKHIQDVQLKSILERHFPLHIRDYNMKVEFLHQASGAAQELPLLKEVGQLQDYTQSSFLQYPPIQPRTMIDNFDDREMERPIADA
jgi:hypothetical protein